MRGLERREDVKIADVHSANTMVASSVIEDILMRGLSKSNDYKCEDVLILLLLLETLVRTQFSEIRNQQATSISCALATCKNVIPMDMDRPDLIFMTLERSSDLKRYKVPHRHCFFAGSKEQTANGIDKDVLHASVELRPC